MLETTCWGLCRCHCFKVQSPESGIYQVILTGSSRESGTSEASLRCRWASVLIMHGFQDVFETTVHPTGVGSAGFVVGSFLGYQQKVGGIVAVGAGPPGSVAWDENTVEVAGLHLVCQRRVYRSGNP